MHSNSLPAYAGKRGYQGYTWQRAYAGNLLAAYTAIAFQGTLWIDPACTSLEPAYGRLRAYQQVIRGAPTLGNFLLRLGTSDIMQCANCLHGAHQEQKGQRYRYELTCAPAQTREGEVSRSPKAGTHKGPHSTQLHPCPYAINP